HVLIYVIDLEIFSDSEELVNMVKQYEACLPSSVQIFALAFESVTERTPSPIFPTGALEKISTFREPAVVVGTYHPYGRFSEQVKKYYGTVLFDNVTPTLWCHANQIRLERPDMWEVMDQMVAQRR